MRLPLILLLGISLCVENQVAAASLAEREARVIVKYREPVLVERESAEARAELMARRHTVTLRATQRVAKSIDVLRARGIGSAELAHRLAADPDIEYAVPDRRRKIKALPNDPLLSTQWYLANGQPSALRVTDAWERTTGNGVTVAVLDTGVRKDHPDLAGKLLPGYDFISDGANAGDGDGRDGDASDAGDFVTDAELADPALKAICGDDLSKSDSSWHGTRVAGIIGAASNNSIGIAGIGWGTRILPIRVLGKCGGFDSDIIAAMRWAAGLDVPGVPANPNPARVVNLSLGGEDTCSAAYQSVVSELGQQRVLVVAAAGNETGAVNTPGNCPGVLAVTGVRHSGTKVGYSSFGPEAGIAAPAGNCVNTGAGEPCLFSIATTTNKGQTTPGMNGYTDEYDFNVGTSFSTPLVAGVAALMLAANPGLTPGELVQRIKQSARAFPSDPELPTCPNVGIEGKQGQCNCTTTSCGAGLLDAAAAVAAALPPSAQIQISGALTVGSLVQLSGAASAAVPGASIVAWDWELRSAPSGASLSASSGSAVQVQAVAAGTYVVVLTVTDNFGARSATEASFLVTAPIPPSPPKSSGGGGAGGLGELVGLFALLVLVTHGKRRGDTSREATAPPK